MKAVLSHAQHPEYGVASIPLPIPKENYDECIKILKGLETGSAVQADCRLEEIHTAYPILERLEGTCVNVDELDYLIKLLEGVGDHHSVNKFQALAISQNIQKLDDLINLAFCFQKIPFVRDFTDLEKIGRSCYMDINGGMMPLLDAQRMDFKAEALNFLQNNYGKVTPYGVIYDEGFQMERIYDGVHFPLYYEGDFVLLLELTSRKESLNEKTPTYLKLPMSELQIERTMLRSGWNYGGGEEIQIRILESRLPEEADSIMVPEKEGIADLNALCHVLNGLDEKGCEKLGAAVHIAQPSNSLELCRLAKELDFFDFIPGIRNAEEYGTYMIIESGYFEYDENLEGFYNFEKYGQQRMQNEYGEFNQRGYICCQGYHSMEEMMGRTGNEAIGFGMGGMKLE